jgi:beta-lactamase class A
MRISFLAVAPLLLLAPASTRAADPKPLSQFKIESLEAPSKDTGPKEVTQEAREPEGPAAIEAASGGRLGIALVDAKGAVLLGFNREERFAMCSTFKAPLAAAVLMGAEQKRYGMDGTLSFGQSDLLDYAPAVKANLKRGRLSIVDLAKAAVQVSDNSAANLLLPLVGGPKGLTAFFRAHEDMVTRLDRTEPTLNENAPGDERDTTSPAAMGGLMARLLFQDMPEPAAAQLRGWLESSTTGAKRIRAGLPKGWVAGDKTGSCGTAFNDVAVLRSPGGRDYVLAIYLDRPTVPDAKAEATISAATSAALDLVTRMEQRAGGVR